MQENVDARATEHRLPVNDQHASVQSLPRVGIDVGGTFTDFVVLDDAGARIHKLSTTPDDQSRAIVAGLRALNLPAAEIVHGMTVATNALLERKGARTALLTTAGFGDVLTIGRQNRPQLYALHQQRAPSLIADGLTFEVTERIGADGAVLTELDEGAINALADALARMVEPPESLAICFLFSFRNPAHEARVAELLRVRLPDLPLSLSSQVLPEYREYERMASTVINAYVQPPVARYLQKLDRALAGDYSVHIMQSNGGLIAIEQAQHAAARLVLSGPAGGVVGAFAVASAASSGEPVNLLTLDMGGTSTDVALCPNRIPTTAESTIGALPLRLPMIDIHTVGAGGGSIARVDAGGALRVGPQSAGAQPGPVCYGRGGVEPTVTDANLVLGRLEAGASLGGGSGNEAGNSDVRLDYAAARAALARLGDSLGLSAEAAALGVLRVANATMERALRTVSVERGHDPRAFTLLPFGGAGPLHACDLADLLGIPRILVPPFPGVLSAWGMLAAPLTSDASLSILQPAAQVQGDPARLVEAVESIRERLIATLPKADEVYVSAALDMRYRGQSYELSAPLDLPVSSVSVAASVDAFHALHEQRYGYAMRDEGVEIVTLRVRAESPVALPPVRRAPLQGSDASHARIGERAIWFSADAPVPATLYDRALLRPGNCISAPAAITQYDTITLIAPGWSATMDAFHNLVLERTSRT